MRVGKFIFVCFCVYTLVVDLGFKEGMVASSSTHPLHSPAIFIDDSAFVPNGRQKVGVGNFIFFLT